MDNVAQVNRVGLGFVERGFHSRPVLLNELKNSSKSASFVDSQVPTSSMDKCDNRSI